MVQAMYCLGFAAVAVAAAAAEPTSSAATEQLDRIMRGDMSKDELEIVLAQYSEDVSWSDKYRTLRTVYCKSSTACAPDAIRLENVGREGHTYLSHIVNNYDKLAKWTVFSQAGEPTVGYRGQNQGGGHMLSGATFSDYLLQPYRAGAEDPGAFFLMTSKVHLPTLHHALRSGYKGAEGQQAPMPSARPSMCPASKLSDNSSDVWGPFEDMPWLTGFISDKCGVDGGFAGEAMLTFWDSFVQLPRPRNDVVHYAQGARFAASRERIRQRSKAFYERLLSLVGTEVDPCLNYLYEWAWYYIVGKPEMSPCTVMQDEEAHAWGARVRMLAGGVSGVSGVSGISGSPEPPTPAPESIVFPAPTPAAPTPAAPTPSLPTPASPTPASPTPASPTSAAPTPALPTPASPTPASPTPASPTPASPTPAPLTPAPSTPAPPTPFPMPTPQPMDASPTEEEHYVDGVIELEVEDPKKACADEDLASALLRAQAQVAEVSTSAVEVACLVSSLGNYSRRLAGTISFTYRIKVVSAVDANKLADKISTTSVDDMANLIQANLPDGQGYEVKVLDISASAVVVTITTNATTTTTSGRREAPVIVSHARSLAANWSVVMALIVAMLMVFSP